MLGQQISHKKQLHQKHNTGICGLRMGEGSLTSWCWGMQQPLDWLHDVGACSSPSRGSAGKRPRRTGFGFLWPINFFMVLKEICCTKHNSMQRMPGKDVIWPNVCHLRQHMLSVPDRNLMSTHFKQLHVLTWSTFYKQQTNGYSRLKITLLPLQRN